MFLENHTLIFFYKFSEKVFELKIVQHAVYTKMYQHKRNISLIISVLRNNEMLISVGPYFSFLAKDVIIFVGTEDVKIRVQNFCNSLK